MFYFKKRYTAITNLLSLLLGVVYGLPIILRSYLSSTSFDSHTLFAFASVFLAFLVLSFFDFLKKRTGFKSIFIVGASVIVILFLIIYSFQFLISNYAQQKSVFSDADNSTQQKNNKNTSTVKPITRDEQVKQNVLQTLGIQQKAEAIITLLKSDNYSELETFLNPTQKFSLVFGDHDYGGVNFSIEEFRNVLQQQKLSEVSVYKRVDDDEIRANTFLNAVSALLRGQYTTDVYLNNHNYIEEGAELSKYDQADLLYISGSKRLRLTFQKDDNSDWFLQEIGYFDPNFPGY